jgi:hypothetical protein
LSTWNSEAKGPLIDEILEPLEETRQIIIAPIRAMLEGLLYINDKERGLKKKHSKPPITTSYMSR